jgi:hypothetical protein
MNEPDLITGIVPWDDRLVCHWIAWEAISPTKLRLRLPPNNVCDMSGAIAVATCVMPLVTRIETTVGGKPDTRYENWCGNWQAFDP